MRSTAALLLPTTIAAALLAGACSKAPEPATGAPGGGEAALQAAITPAVAAAVSAGAGHAPDGIAWRKLQRPDELDAAFDEARRDGRPVFMYWGAVWCPPCNQVKATIFNRSDFIEHSRAFVPIYLDGDLPGAQKLGARFRVTGYPTMVLFRPDGSEITRLPGEVDAQKYLQVLSLGLGGARPIKDVLPRALKTPDALDPADWRLLAYYAWDTADGELLGHATPAAMLRQLADRCPPSAAEARTRLELKALAAEADAADGKKGLAPAAQRSIARERVLTVLSDDALARENLDLVTYAAESLTGWLTAAGTPEREQLATVWAATLDRLSADVRLSQGNRMDALVSRIGLAKLLAPAGKEAGSPTLSTVLVEHVQAEVARADREVTSDYERQSVITTAAAALSDAGLLDASDALLQAELTRSKSPYYAMLKLAANAKHRGDKAQALSWYQRAYDASRGPATRVQWGAGYVNALLELSPQDVPRIRQAATSVLAEVDGQPDAFYERTARSLDRMSGKLLAWNRSADRAAVIGDLRAQRDALCATLPAGDPQRATCSGLFQAGAATKKKATA